MSVLPSALHVAAALQSRCWECAACRHDPLFFSNFSLSLIICIVKFWSFSTMLPGRCMRRLCGQPSPVKSQLVMGAEPHNAVAVDQPAAGDHLCYMSQSQAPAAAGEEPTAHAHRQGSRSGPVEADNSAGVAGTSAEHRQQSSPSRSAASAALASRAKAMSAQAEQPSPGSTTKGTALSSRARLFTTPSAASASPSRLVQQAMQPPLAQPLSPAEKRLQASLSESAAAAAQLSALSVTSPFSAQILARLEELEARTAELRRSLHTPGKDAQQYV
jgi:hypothetical protein